MDTPHDSFPNSLSEHASAATETAKPQVAVGFSALSGLSQMIGWLSAMGLQAVTEFQAGIFSTGSTLSFAAILEPRSAEKMSDNSGWLYITRSDSKVEELSQPSHLRVLGTPDGVEC